MWSFKKKKKDKFLNTLILGEGISKLYIKLSKYFGAKLKYITIFHVKLKKKHLNKFLTVK